MTQTAAPAAGLAPERRRFDPGLVASAESARRAAPVLAALSSDQKNAALEAIAGALVEHGDRILAANRKDMAAAAEAGMSASLQDRLRLDEGRIAGIAAAVRELIALPDPIGSEIDRRSRPNGLQIARVRVPLGVCGVIFESRPNVAVDVAAICLKSGNATVLRGGSEAIASNTALVQALRDAGSGCGLPDGWVGLVENTDRAIVGDMLRMRSHFDVVIPRGGAGLVEFVASTAVVPVLETGFGVCHTYVHGDADLEKAHRIVVNAKTRRPSICNALDTLLVDAAVAPEFLPAVGASLSERGVRMHADPEACALLGSLDGVESLGPGDLDTEWLSLQMSVAVVAGPDAAVEHIRSHGSGHSEAIVTEDDGVGQRFLREIDAAAVYWNASTQFTDGGEFGLGAEVGISTQKLHARGPMGLEELTSYKWVVTGAGQVRPK